MLSVRLELRKLQGVWESELSLDECKERLVRYLTAYYYQFQPDGQRLVFTYGAKRTIVIQPTKKGSGTTFSVIGTPRSFSVARRVPRMLEAKRTADNPKAVPINLVPAGLVTGLGALLVLGQVNAIVNPSTDNVPGSGSYSESVQSAPQLELLSANAERSYSFITIRGMVKNISSEPMENVTAVGIVTDANGEFITSGDSLIDYDPILAGQTSPFSIMIRDNPAIDQWTIEFKEFIGGTIPHKDSRK